jgi:hypothetical protein
MSGSLNPIEDASDAFVCLPSASDTAMLDDAFAATGDVYLAAWRACERLYPLDSEREYTEGDDYFDHYQLLHDEMDADAMFVEVVTPEHRQRARGLGSSVDPVFMFYVRKAIDDHRPRGRGPGSDADPYQPWLHIGFPLPIENVTIETTEDGLDWLRFGEIGPVTFGFTGPVPQRVHTACFKRTDDLSGYEVVFVGEEIDVAGGAML